MINEAFQTVDKLSNYHESAYSFLFSSFKEVNDNNSNSTSL